MKPTPKEWPRISSALFYEDAGAAIEWLCRAFGFEVRLRIDGEGGRVEHSELVYGDAVIMVGSNDDGCRQSPKSLGGTNTQCLMVYVDDVEAHHTRALAAGAKIARALADTNYGEEWYVDRVYEAVDPEGHHWYFTQRLKDAPSTAQA